MSWWEYALLLATLAACWAERRRAAAEARKAKAWNDQTKAALAELVDGAVRPVRAARDGGA